MRREVDKMKGKLLGVFGVLLLAVLAIVASAVTYLNRKLYMNQSKKKYI
jgi:hypothetical protein